MTSKEIIEKLNIITSFLRKYKDTTNLFSTLSTTYKEIGRSFNELSSNGVNTFGEAFKGELEKTSEILSERRVGIIFIELNSLITAIDEVNASLFRLYENSQKPTFPLTSLKESLEEFYLAFEKNVGAFDFASMYELLRIAHDIIEKLDIVDDLTVAFKKLLIDEPRIEEGNEKMSLYFAAPLRYNELIEKLISIQELYKELCRLLKVSASQYPLEIARLEIGSWWIKIFGESKVIALMTSLIESGVSFLHRNYTMDGQIQSIPKKAETIERLLELSDKLKEKGIDTKELEENIKHSSVVISNHLNRLLLGEPNVIVNDKKFYIGEELDQKLLLERKTLQLTTGNPEESSQSRIVE
jgi:hypothetical protein